MDSGCPTTPARIAGMNQKLCESRPGQEEHDPGQSTSINPQLSLSHLIRIKSAEFWLILGDPDSALKELEALSSKTWNHPSGVKVRCDALEVMDERTGASVQK